MYLPAHFKGDWLTHAVPVMQAKDALLKKLIGEPMQKSLAWMRRLKASKDVPELGP